MKLVKFLLIVTTSVCLLKSVGCIGEGLSFLGKGLNLLSNTVDGSVKIAKATANEGVKLANETIDMVSSALGVKDVKAVIAPSQNELGNGLAETKKEWIYKRSPRSGSLYIRTGSGKTLFPGEMNALRNALTIDELISDFTVKLSLAKPEVKYAMVKYANGLLVQAVFNIKGEDLYNGISSGTRVGNVLPGVNPGEISRFLTSGDIRFCVEILEQNSEKKFTTLPFVRNDWNNPLQKWSNELNGVAGKTCFAVLLPNVKNILKEYQGGELGLLLSTLDKQVEAFKRVGQGVKTSVSSPQTPLSSVFLF